jgi:mycothiol synthase
MDIREIGEAELPQLVSVAQAVQPREGHTVGGFVDWRRQASDTVWLVAEEDTQIVGAGVGVVGWHSRPGVARVEAWTATAARGRGIGSALYRELAEWALERGCIELETGVDEDDPESLRWAERHGFREIGRSTRLVLDLTAVTPRPVDPPDGITIVSWAERPGIEAGLYQVYCEAEPDIPGEGGNTLPALEDWLADDMDGAQDRRDAVFVAFADDQVVGYAKLSIPSEGGETAFHDLAGVRRQWRRRGIAGALKRSQIAWAKGQGFSRLVTANEERNVPIRRLNESHGYVAEPGRILLHTMLDASE